ncbi:hypothetical protein ACSLFT_23915 [Streptomyces sp. G6]|uniref:hypothetical protein n=1 Tax=Streptomyces sp. G6 TaxID=1178736 RepID=UPI003EDB2F54
MRFVELSGGAMSALLDGDLSEAGRLAGVSLPECFVTGSARWLGRFRLDQMAADPGEARWMVRYAVVGDQGLVVGHAGFTDHLTRPARSRSAIPSLPASVARDTPGPR